MSWKPGESGNPKGRPPGSRNRLTSAFINALATDFEVNGTVAIERCRTNDPAAYLRLLVSLVPKKLDVAGGITLLDYFAALDTGQDELDTEIAGVLPSPISQIGVGVRLLAAAGPLKVGCG